MTKIMEHIYALALSLIRVTAVCVLVSSAYAGETKLVLTLAKAVSLALEQNRDVLIAEQGRYKANAQVSEARSGAFPQITVSGQYSRFINKPVMFIPANTPLLNPTNSTMTLDLGSNNTYAMTAQLSQALFDQKVGVALDIASTYEEYAEQGYYATEQSVALAVKKAFYAVLLSQKLVEANRQGLDVVRANASNVESLYRHGNAAEFDLLRANVQLANTEPLVVSSENNLVLAKNFLKNLLAVPLDQEIELEGEFTFDEIPKETMDEAERNGFSTNPSMIQLSLQESILEKNISVEQASYFPSLSVVGAYQWQTQDNTFRFNNYLWASTFSVGLQLSYTLFDGFKTSARSQQASIDLQNIRYARLKAEEGLQIQMQSGELKMAEAKKRIQGQEQNIDQAEKAVRIAQTRFKSGVGTQLELLDTQVAMTRAQTNYAQAVYDYLVAKAEWQYTVGLAK
jgi:outer membrane protein TolC